MSQFNSFLNIVGAIGGQTVRAISEATFNLADDDVHLWQQTLADDAADGTLTAWSSSASAVDEPALLAVLVDPGNEQTSVIDVAVEVTADGQVSVFNVNKRCPLVFSSPDADQSDITALSGKITQIRVRNNTAAPSSGTADVDVKVLALK